MSNSMYIREVRAEFFHGDSLTDGMTDPILAFLHIFESS